MAAASTHDPSDADELVVYRARRIHTMNPSWPTGDAVAVRGGRIVEVGTMESLQPWLESYRHRIDDTFADQVLLPGLIDPHLHPAMAAVLLPMEFVTAMEWRLPWGTVRPVTTPEAFAERLRELDERRLRELDERRLRELDERRLRELDERRFRDGDTQEPLFTWGYHPLWHGDVRRPLLDQLVPERPLVVWHRSFHELVMNSAAMNWLGIDRDAVGARAQIDFEGGHFYENGLSFALARLNPYLFEPSRYRAGLERLRRVAHFGGHTTLGDLAVGLFDFDLEWNSSLDILENDDTPFRVQMVAGAVRARARCGSHEAALEFIRALPERNTHRLRFADRVKLFSDGAFFSLLAQLQEPGYLDGHHGEWLSTPEQLEETARLYWNAGFKIHTHCTGDLGLELAIDVLEKLQWERPRFDHGYTIEHFGFSTPEQVERLAALGAQVSANVYYLHELSPIYASRGVGAERAHQMARLGSCARAGVRVALHSDFTMAPALPLHSAWVAATRTNHEGTVVAPNERLTLEQALRAVTLDAAHVLGVADEVGSIRAGKRADFVVLDDDPCEVGTEGLRELQVRATVFEGRPFPV